MTERDFMFQAMCRCVSADYTEAISICNSGYGDPTEVCSPDFGCNFSENGYTAAECTCQPDGIDSNSMTYQQCADQCAIADMIMVDSQDATALAKHTGCGINGMEMWTHVDGASELPDTSADCVSDDTVGDAYGDTCTAWYLERPETCGDYDTDEFVASTMCCSCMWTDLSTDAGSFNTEDF